MRDRRGLGVDGPIKDIGDEVGEPRRDVERTGGNSRAVPLHEARPHGGVLLGTRFVGVVVDRSQPREVVELRAVPPEGVERGDGVHHMCRVLGRAPRDLILDAGHGEILEEQHERGAIVVDVAVVRGGHPQSRRRRALSVELHLVQVEPVVHGDPDCFRIRRRDLGDHGARRPAARGHVQTSEETKDAHTLTDGFDLDR